MKYSSFATKLTPEMASYLRLRAACGLLTLLHRLKLTKISQDLGIQVQNIRNDVDRGFTKFDPEQPPTIFHTLLASDMPDEEKSQLRMGQEALVIIGAGTETTSWSTFLVHLLHTLDHVH